MEDYAETMFGANARAAQAELGMADRYAQVYARRHRDPLDEDTRAFIETRDSFYMSTLTETGWPYVQHRGGPAGFLKVTGPEQIGFADYSGNKQFISKGSIQANPRVALILMDYPRKARLKLVGNARMIEAADDPKLEETLRTDEALPAERLVIIDLVAMDWNCPNYITSRFTEAEIESMLGPKITELTDHIAALQARLDAVDPDWRETT